MLQILKVITLLLLLSSCGTADLKIFKSSIKNEIIHPEPPRQLQLLDYEVNVLNLQGLQEFLNNNKSKSFVILDLDDYEKEIKNQLELERYLLEQKEIILYYRKLVK